MHPTLNELYMAIAVLLGTGGIGKGFWGAAAAIWRRAIAVEAFRKDVRDALDILLKAAADQVEHNAKVDATLADHARRLDDGHEGRPHWPHRAV